MARARKELMCWCLRAISDGCTSVTSLNQCYPNMAGGRKEFDVLVCEAMFGECTSVRNFRSMLCKFLVFDLRLSIPSKFFWFLCS
ncbi:hypothetical protein SLEP1_g25889 [Rubroshorea leprosula]|uniref:Secreted protein n=1 Tax=Rubroshorea leprosula TaxID=152421 RepID=A0AAV5JUQ3_9ROSI|nr:hypothetical protein SLEP1_g25889 [Rubroshorea leprosula]